MRLEGVGGSTATTIPSSNTASQPIPGGDRVNNERREVQKQRRPEEVKHVEEKKYSEEEVIDFIEKANNQFVAYDRKFEFTIHDKTKQIMLKILDSSTNEVIREIPSERVLDMVAGLWEMAGIIVDRKV